MAIGSVVISINGTSHSMVAPEVYLAAYHAEKNRFGETASYALDLTAADLIAAIRARIRYGEFFLLFMSKEAIAYYGDISSDLESLFGVIQYGDAHTDADSDYWCFARRGDMTFVPREGIEARNGQTVSVEVHTSLFEQFGDDGLLFTPITFAGKKLGTVAPKAHRALVRLTSDAKESITNSGSEVTQEEYNVLIRPDMEAVTFDTLEIINENFITASIVTTDLPAGYFAGQSLALKGTGSTSGARQFLGHLLFGPSAMDYSVLNALIENSEASEAGYEAPTTTKPVLQKDIDDKGGFVVESRFFTTQTSSIAGSVVSGKRACFSAFRDSSETTLAWLDGLGVTIRPTLMTTDDDDNPIVDVRDSGNNIFVYDNGSGRGGSEMAKARRVVKPNTYYNIRMLYNEAADNAETGAITLSVWIWEDGKSAPSSPTIEIGSYVPTNRRFDIYTGGAYDQSSGIGIGCESLGAGEYWAFDYLQVRNTSKQYAQLLVDLDMTGQHEKVDFMFTLRGKGHSAGAEVFGHDISVWDFFNEAWVSIQRRVYDQFRVSTVRFSLDLLPEYLSGSHLYFLISAPHPQESSALATAISSRIELDYVYGRSVGTAKKVYGKTDLYFVQTADLSNVTGGTVAAYRPSVVQEIIIPSATDINMLTPGSAYEDINGAALTLSGPIEQIMSVELMQQIDDSTPKYQVIDTLRPGQDYLYFWDNPTLRGSMQERMAFVVDADFADLPIRIKLRSHNRVQSVDTYLQTASSRKLDSDLLARHKRSVFVDVYARYSGVVTGNLTEKLREWIYSFSGKELQSSDISRFLLDQGATQILLFDGTNSNTALVIEASRIDDNGTVVKERSQVLLRRAATETFVPGTVKLISVA